MTWQNPTSERLGFWRRWHSYLLDVKGLGDDTVLGDAIVFDRRVAELAARDLVGATTSALVASFLPDDDPSLEDAVMAASDEVAVNHEGFRIRLPLDIWLEDLEPWAESVGFTVVGVKRFTASSAFQARVGAFVEMAQVWLTVDRSTVELELFDIHSSRAAPPPGEAAVSRSLADLLIDDDIRHYGVRIGTEAEVEALHTRFTELVAADDRYVLRNEATVANRWHGSVHTKVANRATGTEIEFLSYNVDWSARGG